MSDLILPPRYDGIANAASGALTNRYTGMNTSRDKSTRWEAGYFYPLNEQDRGIFHAGSFECQRVCEVLPEEMTRAGWEIAIDDGDNDLVSKASDYDKKLGLRQAFEQAEFHRRLDDGAIVILLIDDGQTPDKPVNESRVRSLLPIPRKNILSRWQVSTSDISSDPEFYKVWYQSSITDPKGEAVTYQYKDWSGWIHKSRVLRFDDGSCSRLIRQQNQGWSPGALLRFVQVYQAYFSGFQALSAMLQDASLFTYAIKGLGDILMGGGEGVLRDRLAENWLATSVYGAIIHDSENEKVGFTERNLSGWDSSLDRLERRLVAASEMPHSYLLGRAGPSGGLTGNGDDEARLMASIANRKQEKCFRKHLEYCYRLIFAAKDGPTNGKEAPNYTVNFRPLALPSPMEMAELESTVIQKDVQAISAGIYTAEDALRSHYSTPNFNPGITIDWEKKDQELEEAKQQAEEQQFAEEPPPEEDQSTEEQQPTEDFNLEEFQGDSADRDESVTWKYGTGTAIGKVIKEYDRPITLTIKKKPIKRNGSQDNPALLIEQEDGSRVLKLRSEVRSDAVPDKYSHINFVPPLAVRKAAKRGMELRRKHGRGGLSIQEASKMGIGSGVARARDLSSGNAVSPETIGRMLGYFSRHASDRKAKGFNQGDKEYPSNGRIAWELWGGDAGLRWAKSVQHQMIAADAKAKRDSVHLDKKCGGSHIADNLKCHAGVAAEHLGENIGSWAIGKTVGGAIASLATSHGLDPGVARVMSEAGVQALAATAIHARKKENRNASELTTKFLSELAGASAGKVLHHAVETNDDGLLGDDYVKALVATISGKAGGIVTTTSAAKALKRQGELLKGVLGRINGVRADADSGDDIQLSNAERSALLDLSLAGYLIGLGEQRSDSIRFDGEEWRFDAPKKSKFKVGDTKTVGDKTYTFNENSRWVRVKDTPAKAASQEGDKPKRGRKKKVESQLDPDVNAKAEAVVEKAKKKGTAKKKAKAATSEETDQETAAKPKRSKAKKAEAKPEETQPKEQEQPKAKKKQESSDEDGTAPTLTPKKYNKDAIEDLDVDEFKRFRRDRDFLKVQDDPKVPINQSFDDWKKGQEFQSLATKAKYKGELTDAISAGYAPSDKILSSAGVKLTKKQQAQLEKNRKDIEAKRQQNARIQKAIDHPLMTDEEAKGYKPVLSKEEADRYTRGSFVGNSSFYHGNRRDVIDSMRTDGIQPDRNNAGIFGKGAYFATSKEVAESYANAASTSGEGRVGLIEAKAKVKNPYVMTAEQLSNIGSHFPGDQSTLVDSTAIQEFIKAKGHDSIYIPDKGYFVTFDQRQAVTVNSEDFTRGDARQTAIAKFWEKRLTGDDENAVSRDSDTFKRLSQAKPSESRKYQYADDNEEEDFEF